MLVMLPSFYKTFLISDGERISSCHGKAQQRPYCDDSVNVGQRRASHVNRLLVCSEFYNYKRVKIGITHLLSLASRFI